MKLQTSLSISCTFAAVFIGLQGSLAYGQSKSPYIGGLPANAQTNQVSLPAPSGATIALEGVIDPTVYVLGPGDKLSLEIWGAMEGHEELTVAPDGMIAASGIGAIPVAGLTLETAEKLTQERALASFPRASINLRLIGVRKMKAIISGTVQAPGTYEVSAVDRLTTLIDLAQGLKIPDEEDEKSGSADVNFKDMTPSEQRRAREEARIERESRPEASLRHITITSKNGDVRSIDLQNFYLTGDPQHNPMLSDGDVVNVPQKNRKIGVLNIYGAVKSPGEYEYRVEDKLADLISLAGGFRPEAYNEDILIIRFDGASSMANAIHASYGSKGSEIPLMPDDRVFVRKIPDYRQKYQVTVKGEVNFPGSYSIKKDSTRLTDILKDCGGITDRANLTSARVVRRSMIEAEDPEFERLKAMSVSEMTDMEYEYFKIRSRDEAPSVVANFKKLIEENDLSQDIVLQDKDEIEIPTLSPTVKVAGQVNNPGLIRYVPGENYQYYIQKAGGFSWNARIGKLRLIKAHSGTWMKPKKSTPIEIGDTIFIPEKQEVDWWEVSKDLLLVASQVATVLIMVKSL